MTATPRARSGPGPLVRVVGRGVNSTVVHCPWTWRFLRRPVRRFFDSLAAGWDDRVRSDSAEFLAPLVAALDHLPASPNSPTRVLDIGTGTGAAAFELADRFPVAEVIGIDVSAQMITHAETKTPDPNTRVRFVVADIANYQDDQRFDLIVMVNMPPFFDSVAALLAPGGFVVHASSYGPRTPFFTPPGLLKRGFERLDLHTIAAGQAEMGTYYLARRP